MKGLAWIAALGLVLAALFALYPSFAEETFRLQAFGWVLETRQGPLLIALVALAFVVRLVRNLLGALWQGPGRFWGAWRAGTARRREQKLREAIEAWINHGRPLPARLFAREHAHAPAWLLSVFAALTTPGSDARLPEDDEADPLLVAATARAISDPEQPHAPDPIVRRKALEAWLARYPDALIAHERLAALAEETGDWALAERELAWLQEHGAHIYARLAPRLVRAWVELAKDKDAAHARRMLERVLRIAPDHEEAALKLADLLVQQGDAARARTLLEELLEKRPSFAAARRLLALMPQPEKAWKRWAKRPVQALNPAQAWFAAMLARRAGLAEVARARMQKLAEKGVPEAWASLARWAEEEGRADEALSCYRQALAAAGLVEEETQVQAIPAPQPKESEEATSGLAATRNGARA